jgi:hypothetical protein
MILSKCLGKITMPPLIRISHTSTTPGQSPAFINSSVASFTLAKKRASVTAMPALPASRVSSPFTEPSVRLVIVSIPFTSSSFLCKPFFVSD